MKEHVKKLNVSWPTVVAVALAVTLITMYNDHVREENEKRIIENNIVTFEETFNKSDFFVNEVELNEIIKPEEEKEANFSK